MSGQISRVVAGLVVAGLGQTRAAELLAQEDLSWLDKGVTDGVALMPYRQLLEKVLARYGAEPILQSGRSLLVAQHPILFVLLNSPTPDILIDKEARLRKFLHSRHEVTCLESESQHLLLRHHSGDSPPHIVEHLAASGQHKVLLEAIGCQDVQLIFPLLDPHPIRFDRLNDWDWSKLDAQQLSEWRFQWRELRGSPRALQGLDDWLLNQVSESHLLDDRDTCAEVQALLMSDLGRSWKLADIADALGCSPRTLQRRLNDENVRFSGLLLRTRVQEAQRLLRNSVLSVTEIGFACGFSDTAHFARVFQRHCHCSPSQWRSSSRVECAIGR